MARQYSFSFFKTIGLAAFLIIFTAFITAKPASAADDPAYTVEGVKVDITADNAVNARQKAFDQAQQDAFRQLAQRVLTADQMKNFQAPPADQITTMVDDYEITSEQLSKVRYIGTYTFRFRHAATNNFFSTRGIVYNAPPAKPVLVLPYYQQGTHATLWDENNPWLLAWRHAQSVNQLTGSNPVVLPLGEAEDFTNMQDDHALDYEANQLQAMETRYDTSGAVIMIAMPSSDASALTIAIYRAQPGAPPQLIRTLHVTATDLTGVESLFDAAVRLAHGALSESKPRPVAPAALSPSLASLTVNVHFASMAEWLQTQRTMRQLPGVADVKILSLKPDEAVVAIRFQGSEDRIRAALDQAGIDAGDDTPAPQVQDINHPSGWSPANPDAAYSPRTARP